MSDRIFEDNEIGREARIAIRGQRHRCNGPNASDYKYYGGKGIRVIYTSKEFFKWFKEKRKRIPLNIKVNVDRINHNKNYTLKNIRLIPKVDNVIESNIRRGKLNRKIVIKLMKKGITQKEIGEKFNVAQTGVSAFCIYHNIKWKRHLQ